MPDEKDMNAVNPEDLDTEEAPAFIDDRERELFAVAQLGIKTQQFMNTEVGRMMIGYAEQEIHMHALALLDVSPDDHEKVQEHRFKAHVAMLFKQFLDEAINSGEAAYQQLDSSGDL